ncbi:MAG: hypothetical protein JNM56_23060 [Planctomycetia bacterium]|nr:hypothetical protein [Planctomycetia bacterium]
MTAVPLASPAASREGWAATTVTAPGNGRTSALAGAAAPVTEGMTAPVSAPGQGRTAPVMTEAPRESRSAATRRAAATGPGRSTATALAGAAHTAPPVAAERTTRRGCRRATSWRSERRATTASVTTGTPGITTRSGRRGETPETAWRPFRGITARRGWPAIRAAGDFFRPAVAVVTAKPAVPVREAEEAARAVGLRHLVVVGPWRLRAGPRFRQAGCRQQGGSACQHGRQSLAHSILLVHDSP